MNPAPASTPRRRWTSLPGDERRALLQMLVMVPVFHVAVRVWDYQRTRAFVDRRSEAAWLRASAAGHARPVPPSLYGRASQRMAARPWVPGNCLSRSLAVLWFLKRYGYQPDLRLGVSLAGGTFAAHAWVELDGAVVNDRPDVATRFAPLTGTPQIHPFDRA